MTTRLEPLREAHWPVLNTFTLPLEQEKYTTLPIDLESPLADGIHPIVIVAEEPVGFFLLHDTERVASYTEADDALLLSMFSITHSAQGNGHAKAALHQLPNYVRAHFPHKHEVVLSVNLKNEAAFSLYQAVGFVDTGRRIDGPIGPQHIMSLAV
ncbi:MULTISPECIES: GNAT family N-acetyltransferase [Exiguobacterium]|uniref:GNAT family N-acetyltransferase n=1 Tax=Exiguobacterium TaxID=33986 RepID=UPI001BE7AF72|nr:MULTISPECIES: GNAT family N-acetyltransferase [Exiguobacterium]MCT4777998.1 GNAT family N-acetyltransferase [Exiguobacterium aquaticum]MCT4790235.1 GNAT family N-acetyltransferase [Exiguobacterium mexicanum]